MQPSPKKSFATPKKVPQTLSEPNTNERYIQHRSIFPSITNFNCQEVLETEVHSCYSSLIQQNLFSNKPTDLFQTSLSQSIPFRNIPTKPYKILDAPDLQNNFYYSVLDWSSSNTIGIALSTQVYLYDVASAKVHKLFQNNKNITSLKFSHNSSLVALGLESGEIMLFDVENQEFIKTIKNHKGRVGVLRWNQNILTSGGHDCYLVHTDIRLPQFFFRTKAHNEEVCGIEWDGDTLATGSNDNTVNIWNNFAISPTTTLKGHTSAVKSMAWSPFDRKVLITGGGANDKTIKTWNALTGKCINETQTGSQVCSLLFSEATKEIISGHGYSRNEIGV